MTGSYPIRRTRGVSSPNELSIGDRSLADLSIDFSECSDGLSALGLDGSFTPHNNDSNVVNHRHLDAQPFDPSSPSNTTYNDPYASVADDESGASPSLHLGSDNGKASNFVFPDTCPPVRSSILAQRMMSARDLVSSQKLSSTSNKSVSDDDKARKKCCAVPDWLAEAPRSIKLIIITSTSLLVVATILLAIVAVGNSVETTNDTSVITERPTRSSSNAPMNEEPELGFIPAASYQETREPTSWPTGIGLPIPSLSPISTATVSASPTLSTTDIPFDCKDFVSPFQYVLDSGGVQTTKCSSLSSDTDLSLESKCNLAVVAIPALGTAGKVSDMCPKRCNDCRATSQPSSSPSAFISTHPSANNETDSQTNSEPPRQSTFFVTGGHFKRADSIDRLLDRLPQDNGAFLMHLGDSNRPQWRECDDRSWEIVLEIWSSATIPMLSVPGEMDWSLCKDPDYAWYLWEDMIGAKNVCCNGDEEKAIGTHLNLSKQEGGTENFAFVQSHVLYVGLHLVSGPEVAKENEWNARLNQAYEWLVDNVANYREVAEVIAIFAHSTPTDETNIAFFDKFAVAVEEWSMPVMYFYQDHEIENPWTWKRDALGASNLLTIGIRSKLWPPLRVIVDTDKKTFNLDNEQWHIGLLPSSAQVSDSLQVFEASAP